MVCRAHVSLVKRRSAKKRQRKCAMPVWNRVLGRHSARQTGMTQCMTENAPTAFKRSPRSCAAAAEMAWVGLGSRNVHGDIRMISVCTVYIVVEEMSKVCGWNCYGEKSGACSESRPQEAFRERQWAHSRVLIWTENDIVDMTLAEMSQRCLSHVLSASRSCAATVRKVCIGLSSRSLHGDTRMVCRAHVSLVQRRRLPAPALWE